MKIEFLGYVEMLPKEVKVLPFSDLMLLLEAKREREKNNQIVIRRQTALIVEALIGNGKGVRFVMDSWKLNDEESQELSVEQIREVLKKKRERDVLKKLNKK